MGSEKMNFEAVCRTCLGTKSLSPIFKLKDNHEQLSSTIMNITGLTVKMFDGLPQNICSDCMKHINTSLKFRAECKNAEKKLQEMYNLKNVVKTEKIEEDTVLFEEKSYELFIDVKSVKTEEELSDDDKPLIDLFDETEKLKNNQLETDSKVSKITITENIILDPCMFKKSNEKTNSDKCGINNTVLNKIKTECESQTKNAKVTCGICKKHLSIQSINAHMKKKHPRADITKIKCEFCDAHVLKMKMNRHLRMIHGNNSSICRYCKLEFRSKEVLLEHVSKCTGKKTKYSANNTSKEMSECDICHKKMQKGSLKLHQNVKHAGLGPTCDHCGKKFANKFRLNGHLRSKHGYEKYKCGQCDFQSANTMALRNHERQHRGEKPYVCEECGRGFHATYLLAQHAQSHRTARLQKCDLCPASYKSNNSLHMHKLACHSNTTYKCMLCERAYSCRQYVVKHLRRVHGYSGPVQSLEQKSK